jgi:hypothetical protein
MAKTGIFSTLRDFLGAGGHISVGIGKALGWTQSAASGFVRRHLVGVSDTDHNRIMDIAERGVEAGRLMDSLPSDIILPPDKVLIVPEQYGDDAEGKRINYGLIVGENDDDVGKLIRIDTEDFKSKDELAEMLDAILDMWVEQSPEAFTDQRYANIKANAIRTIYSTRKY